MAEILTKICGQCGVEFSKTSTCGKPEWSRRQFCSRGCKQRAQIGQETWNKGMRSESQAQKVACRICGNPTRHNGGPNSPLIGKIPCENPACVAESKRLKNEAIADRARQMYADGSRQKIRTAWSGVKRVSPEEIVLRPWFESLGWETQYCVLTEVHTNKLPRMFRLDFALPAKKLCVEIDGTVHRLRKERDARRDSMLSGLGWRCLRIESSLVRNDPREAKKVIASWIALT